MLYLLLYFHLAIHRSNFYILPSHKRPMRDTLKVKTTIHLLIYNKEESIKVVKVKIKGNLCMNWFSFTIPFNIASTSRSWFFFQPFVFDREMNLPLFHSWALQKSVCFLGSSSFNAWGIACS